MQEHSTMENGTMTTRNTLLTLAVVLALGGVPAFAGPEDGKADGKKKPAGPLCPVMGGPIDFTVSMMTDDGPVFFCCPPCGKKLEADPKKYEAKVQQQRKALAKLPRIQVSCPVTGKPISKKANIEHEGKKVYFFCDKCPEKYKKDPAKYKAKLAASYTYQVRCPISDEEIDPTVLTKLKNGQKVFFCCKACIRKFKADPAKYVPSLQKQGHGIDVEDVKG